MPLNYKPLPLVQEDLVETTKKRDEGAGCAGEASSRNTTIPVRLALLFVVVSNVLLTLAILSLQLNMQLLDKVNHDRDDKPLPASSSRSSTSFFAAAPSYSSGLYLLRTLIRGMPPAQRDTPPAPSARSPSPKVMTTRDDFSSSFSSGPRLPSSTSTSSGPYSVSAHRLPSPHDPKAMISHPETSSFKWAYNPAYVDVYSSSAGGDVPCLLVRAQNPESATNPHAAGPSVLVATCAASLSLDIVTGFSPVTQETIVVQPNGSAAEAAGTEDPRLVRVNGIFYLFYTAVQQLNASTAAARLSLAVCSPAIAKAQWVKTYGIKPPDYDELTACFVPTGSRTTIDIQRSWVRRGQLLPNDQYGYQFTKSGALLLRNEENDPDKPPTPGGSLLIFGDCSIYPGLQMMTLNSWDSYNLLPGYLMEKRPGNFDSGLIESGPPPLRLATGDYLFLYNGAQPLKGVSNGYFYNPGFAIINGRNPQQVLQRSDTEPVMFPLYRYETWGLTPFVVFPEGLRYAPGSEPTAERYKKHVEAKHTISSNKDVRDKATPSLDSAHRYTVTVMGELDALTTSHTTNTANATTTTTNADKDKTTMVSDITGFSSAGTSQSFIVYYGAGDSTVAAAEVVVSW